MLEAKLQKAAQAIIKNNCLIIASGSGMVADCPLVRSSTTQTVGNDCIPIFRGTQGLWREYPAFRKQLIQFEHLVTEDFFRNFPEKYWFVYGDLFMKY